MDERGLVRGAVADLDRLLDGNQVRGRRKRLGMDSLAIILLEDRWRRNGDVEVRLEARSGEEELGFVPCLSARGV